MWQYRAQIEKVVDGDTLNVALDLGLDVTVRTVLRLAGLNAPEHGTPEGDAATAFVTAWVLKHQTVGGWFTVMTTKDRKEKYGRYLATVTSADGGVLNAELLAAGHALPWDGHGPKPV
jgi:micrococcal nuclease